MALRLGVRLGQLGATRYSSYIRATAILKPRTTIHNLPAAFYATEPPSNLGSKEHETYPNFSTFAYKTMPLEDSPRSILLCKLPRFALKEDVRNFLKNFPVERVIMGFEGARGMNLGHCHVIFDKPDTATSAIEALGSAKMFGKQIELLPCQHTSTYQPSIRPQYYWGWLATDDADPEQMRVRPPLLCPPDDIFAPLLQGRRVVLSSLPDIRGVDIGAPKRGSSRLLMQNLYSLLHRFNVMAMGNFYFSPGVDTRKDGVSVTVDFATHDEAQSATSALNGTEMFGRPIRAALWQPPKKHLVGVVWDQGPGGGHFSGEQDQGSAKITNLEPKQQKILRKSLLGKMDRNLYVNSNSAGNKGTEAKESPEKKDQGKEDLEKKNPGKKNSRKENQGKKNPESKEKLPA